MSVTAICGGCTKSFVLGEKFYGKKAKCKNCGGVFSVPHPSEGGVAVATAVAKPKPSAPRVSPQAIARKPAVAATSRVPTSPVKAPVKAAVKAPARPVAKQPVRQAPPPPPESDTYDLDDPNSIYNLPEAPPAPPPRAVIVEKDPAIGKGSAYVSRTGPKRSAAVEAYDRQAKFWMLFHLIAFGLPVLLLIIGKASEGFAPIAGLVAFLIGLGMCFAGNIGVLVVAAREGVVHVMLCLFIPFYSLYFIVSHLDETKGHVGRSLGGVALIFFAGFMMPASDEDDTFLDEEVRRPVIAHVQYA